MISQRHLNMEKVEPTRTVLVVDDDLIAHRVLQHYLKRAGIELSTANNGRQALEIAARDLPQLIIMDLMMPEMSGFETLRQLKSIERTKEIPVIVLTGSAMRVSELASAASGADVFLTKPFSRQQLLTTVQRFVRESLPRL